MATVYPYKNGERMFTAVVVEGHSAFAVNCHSCGVRGTISAKGKTLPYAAIVRQFHNKGWDISKKPKNDTCPDCLRKPKKETTPMPKSVAPAPVAGTPAPPPPVEAVTPVTNKEARHLVYLKLVDEYDDTISNYRTETDTDESIAKDLGVPVALVTDVRENSGSFGPLKPRINEKLEAARKEANDLAQMLRDHLKKVEEQGNEAVRALADIDKIRATIFDKKAVIASDYKAILAAYDRVMLMIKELPKG